MLLIGSVVYAVLRFLQGTRGARLVRAVLTILGVSFAIAWLIAERFEFERINVLYPYFILGVFFVSLVAFQAELRRSGFEDLVAAGVVLTGGTSKMEGVIELAEEIFHMPVRLGIPKGVNGLVDVISSPIYSTGVGLLQFGQNNRSHGIAELAESGGIKTVFERMKSWFQGNF